MFVRSTLVSSGLRIAGIVLGSVLAMGASLEAQVRSSPNILIVTIDTLRWDRLSFNGYERPTSPHLDELMSSSASFSQARTPEPLTAPAMSSMVTSLHPHEHASSRNGLRIRSGLSSFAKTLAKRRRYDSAAFVSNWTLKDRLSGLGEHFEEYNEVFSRTRWYLFKREADANDLTDRALSWIEDRNVDRPFLVWVHYIDPHAPYRFHEEFAEDIGVSGSRPPAEDRYDTEIAFVDRAVGTLLRGVEAAVEGHDDGDLLIVFASDHGESLGEHEYWGHGRHLYEPTLRIPMSIGWQGRIQPRKISATASLIDVGPTLFGLLGVPIPESYRGFDWSGVLLGSESEPSTRTTWHQTHKGAVHGESGPSVRSSGLLAVSRVVDGGLKEILYTKSGDRFEFDLVRDAAELARQSENELSPDLRTWLDQVTAGLASGDSMPTEALDEESIEKLRALGYID